MTDTTTAWETDHGTLVLFADVLVTTGCLIEPREVVDFFDRPHKWSPEFHAWHRNGSPRGAEDHGWDDFLAALTVLLGVTAL
jgi:hypothetical protein